MGEPNMAQEMEALDSPMTSDTPEVSQSLVGLVGAIDKLKEDLGMGGVDLSVIEQFIQEIEAENVMLHQHASDAIHMAQLMKEENSSLLEEVTQLQVKNMVNTTQELTAVAYEYDKEMVQSKVADAEAVLVEVGDLRERVLELEEENAALIETLNETRQSQQQLQRLQALEQQQPEGGSSVNGAAAATAYYSPPVSLMFNIKGDEGADVHQEASSQPGDALGSPLPSISIGDAVALTPPAAAQSSQISPRLPTSGFKQGTPQPEGSKTPGTVGKDPLAVADALSAVAGGAEGGVAAAAARMLREYSTAQQELEQERASKKKLEKEVAELTETMTAKTFKAPSAWAEREVKYKQDKKKWDESQKEAETKIAGLQTQLDALRASTGAADLDRRIEELEARLLESERDRDAARAALHEMQLATMANSGEFSNTGVKPYRGPRMSDEGEVQQVVNKIESSGGTPRKVIGLDEDTSRGGAGGAGGEDMDLMHQVSMLQRENTRLRAQLEKTSAGTGAPLETPQAVREALSSSTTKRAKDLQEQLEQTQQERVALAAELQALRVAAGAARPPSPRLTLQLNLTEARTEVALLQRGVDCETAHSLAVLEAKLQEAQYREKVALETLEETKAALAAATAAAATAGQELSPSVPEPAEVSQQTEALEEHVRAIEEEKHEIESQMRDVAAAAASTAPLAAIMAQPPALVVVQEEETLEEVPSRVADILAEVAATTSMAAAAAVTDDVQAEEEEEQGESGGALAPAAEDRLQQLLAQLRIAENSGEPAALKGSASESFAPVVLNLNLENSTASLAPPPPSPVVLKLNLDSGAAGGEQTTPIAPPSEAPSPVILNFNLEAGSAVRAAPPSPSPVVLNLAVQPDESGKNLSDREEKIKKLEDMLVSMVEEENRLRNDLQSLAPVKLNFSLAGDNGGGAPGTGMSRRDSAVSLTMSPEHLAHDRAEAEAAWEDHLKRSDVPSLLRAKAELETKCEMLQTQLDKAQAALADADIEKGYVQESIDDVLKTGDVGMLAGLRDGLRTGTARVMQGKRFNKVFKRKPSAKQIKTALHESQGALVETEAERNTLRRQLARISKKYKQAAGTPRDSSIPEDGHAEDAAQLEDDQEGSITESEEGSQNQQQFIEDAEKELLALRDENNMLMEHLVTTKVRLAEVEGDYLESRRALLRSREKQMQLARQYLEVQAASGPMGEPPAQESPKTATTIPKAPPPEPERRRSLKLPGLELKL